MSSRVAAPVKKGASPEPISAGLIRMAGMFVLLALFVRLLGQWGYVDPSNYKMSSLVTFYLLTAQDFPVAIASICILLFLLFLPERSFLLDRISGRETVWALGALTLVLTVLLTKFAHLGFDMSLDEFSSAFQARIFLNGQVAADIPAEFADIAKNMQPAMIYTDSQRDIWMSNYRPGFALLRAISEALGIPGLLNPILATIAVLATAAVARRVFPGHQDAPILAALLLALTPQMLLMASANFAHTAYLAFNMVWLALFLGGSIRSHIAAALIGGYAISLHQVHVHPLFAMPFLLALMLGQFGSRWHLLPYVIVYAAAGTFAILWVEIATWLHTGDVSVFPRSVLDIAYFRDFLGYRVSQASTHQDISGLLTSANLLRFGAWLSPALLVLTLAAFRRGMRLPLIVWLCGVSVLLTIAAHHVLMANQMQSWGSRYYNPVLGALVIFALGAFLSWREGEARRTGIDRRLAVLLAAGLVVFVPWRGIQVHDKVAPRAALQKAISEIDADIVLWQSSGIWFGIDPLRNDPLFEDGPVMIFDKQLATLPHGEPSIVTVGVEMAREFGLAAGTLMEPGK